MKFSPWFFSFVCLFAACAVNSLAIDREAFTIRNYDLNLRIEPEQNRLGVRGKITLRNDTATPQKLAVLQVSSALDWRSISMADQPVQFVAQSYASDIDHTGALSEAIITLPAAIAPHTSVELNIGYEGTIPLDATRLTRIGTPEDAARSAEWDEISPNFTALRGAGYVAWYPIATDSANLSDGDSLFETLNRWKSREAGADMHLRISVNTTGSAPPQMFLGEHPCTIGVYEQMDLAQLGQAECKSEYPAFGTPLLLIADYSTIERSGIEVHYLHGHDAAAAGYASEAEKLVPLITDWFGPLHQKAKIAELPAPGAAPFESGTLLLTPLDPASPDAANSLADGLSAAHQLTHAAIHSFRPWIEEGLAHFAQVLYLEREKGREAALDYMQAHRSTLIASEKSAETPQVRDEVARSLINTDNEELYRSKAMYVWWMLREMVGDAALKKALAEYRPQQDKEPSYIQRLIAAHTQRDLEWFFDDWVYRDRGLPDFKIESVFSRKAMTKVFLVTITVDNLGAAGAEVPVLVKFSGGELSKRLEVRAKDKATIRMETPAEPQEIIVNDGSVPESNRTNEVYKVASPDSQ